MTPQDKLQLIRAIEEKEVAHRRRADWVAWGSVILAAVVLVVMIAAASRELNDIQAQVAVKQKELSTTQAELSGKKAELTRTEDKVRGLQSVLGTLSDQQQALLVDKTLKRKPETAKILPRIYMQIVAVEDHALAEQFTQKLRDAGFLVLGIELRTDAAGIKATDVRFYRKEDQPEAERILAVLQSAGENRAKLNYLARFENSPSVRPNHFEIWLARHSGTPR